jgi:hypothetical protein
VNFHCKNRIPKCIWNQRHPRIDCFTSYQSYLRTNNLIMTYLREKTWTQPMNHSCHTNQPTNHPSRQVLQHRRCWRPGWSHPLSCHGKLGTSINEGQNGQIRSNPPIFMRLFKWKEHKKKWRNHPPIFMFIFFVERKSINGGKSPNVYVYVFFFLRGKSPINGGL